MKSLSKRRSTQPGLGKIEDQHARQQTGTRRKVVVDDAPVSNERIAAFAKPRVVADAKTIAAAPIDHRAAFLLSFIDGKTIVRDLLDVSAMDRAEIDAVLSRLRELGIIAIA